jgi:hypothetical protein
MGQVVAEFVLNIFPAVGDRRMDRFDRRVRFACCAHHSRFQSAKRWAATVPNASSEKRATSFNPRSILTLWCAPLFGRGTTSTVTFRYQRPRSSSAKHPARIG